MLNEIPLNKRYFFVSDVSARYRRTYIKSVRYKLHNLDMKDQIFKLYQNFIKNLKVERNRLKLSQRKMAKLMGISSSSYNAYETGVSTPSFENLLKISLILDVGLDYLFEIER